MWFPWTNQADKNSATKPYQVPCQVPCQALKKPKRLPEGLARRCAWRTCHTSGDHAAADGSARGSTFSGGLSDTWPSNAKKKPWRALCGGRGGGALIRLSCEVRS